MLDDGAIMPERAHAEDAGMDLRTNEDITIMPGGSAVIDTGVHMAIPEGYFGKLESKSGLNVKHGIVSCGGVIDCGYTGPIKVKLYNLGDKEYHFHAGDKIAQIIIQPCLLCNVEQTDILEETERGDGGFGSTGVSSVSESVSYEQLSLFDYTA